MTIVCQGFAEYVVSPARQCRPLPDGLDYARASMIGDMVGTPIAAVKRAARRVGESVAVWGLGPVGLGLVQASLIAGARWWWASTRWRSDALAPSGCAPGAGSVPEVRCERLRELTGGRGPDVALCSVSADGAVRAAFESLRLDGRMVTVAGFPPAGGEERKWVSGSWGCDERLWPEVLDHLCARRFVLDELRHPHASR